MDIEKIFEELRAERNRLEVIIVALERLYGTDAAALFVTGAEESSWISRGAKRYPCE